MMSGGRRRSSSCSRKSRRMSRMRMRRRGTNNTTPSHITPPPIPRPTRFSFGGAWSWRGCELQKRLSIWNSGTALPMPFGSSTPRLLQASPLIRIPRDISIRTGKSSK
eukprot:6979514-Pyramimonas_sp.AAC.1